MPEHNARRLAFDVLFEVECRSAFADAALGRALARGVLDRPEERRLATQLVYGVLAERLRLDHTIAAYARRAKLDPRVAIALRLGIYQLAFLQRVPAYAAVDTTVALVRSFAPHASGFANALVRRVAREGLASLPAEEPERTAVGLSHPTWLVEMWREEMGHEEAAALMASNNRPMPNVLRALADHAQAIEKLRELGLEAEPTTYAPAGIRASAPVRIPKLALPQGEASQLVVLMTGAQPGERVLDACAAPGGKTAYLAALVGERGRIIAVDPAANAPRRIRATCTAADVRNVEIVQAAIENARDLGIFDLVLVDAPCSGLGTLREHPEIRWRRTRADIEALAARQRAILEHASACVRVGGRLVYATCTISRAENDAVVDAFLATHANFEEDAPANSHAALRCLLDDRGRLRTWPHRHDLAGFFAARLVRRA